MTPKGRLFLKYVVLFAVLVSGALVTSGLVEIYFAYQENKAALVRVQREKAVAAALRIEQFVREVARQIGWIARSAGGARGMALEQRRADSLRLLREVPAITEVSYLDPTGHEQVRVSRLAADVVGGNADFSREPKFLEARARKTYVSPVYFREGSEPYMTIALAGSGEDAGAIAAEVNLKFIWDVVSQIKIGKNGYAYVVDSRGRLIAHPDISLVLQKSDLSSLPQVRAANAAAPGRHETQEEATIARDLQGHQVLTASAPIALTGWLVFVDLPLAEALAPLYAAMLRTGLLVLVGLGMSLLASLLLARKMVTPIRALQAGAARIGAGALDQRIEVKTGDELEALAEEFNRMAGRLRESYAGLERKVQERTRDLTEALDQQTATAEILRVISQSPTDVQPVFDAIAASALRLCGAAGSLVTTFDGELIHLAAVHVARPEGVDALRRMLPARPSRTNASGRAILTRAIVHIPDVREDPEYADQDVAQVADYRSLLAVPMLRYGHPIGSLHVLNAEPGPFTDAQVELLKTFADQAVIAIENVRLFTELQARTAELGRSVEELRALGEVGRAVSSTLDLETVLTTIISRANQLSGTDGGWIYEYDDASEEQHLRAVQNFEDELVDALRTRPLRKGEGVTGRVVAERVPVQVPDITAEGAYQSRVRDELIRAGYRAFLAVPLVREEQVIGGLVVGRKRPGEFPREVVELLATFASQSALAMQNARLFRELEEKGRQLEIASQHKSTFLANMSHELRTPLNAIIGYSEMLQEDATDLGAAGLVPDLKKVNAAGQHLLELINAILDLSKIEAGKMELHLEDFSVAGMVEDIVALVRPLAEQNGNRLEVRCDEAAGTMHADLTKVRQVLLNLLSNACKFTDRGVVGLDVGRDAAASDEWLSFGVSDTGIGLTAEQLGRLFQEFSQADAATTRKYGGTGLGLALSRRLCRLMGGDVTAVSQPGQGSTFTVRLPANVGGRTTETTGAAADVAGPGGSGTVLVIDDEASVRDLMGRFLSKDGLRVITAASGEDGLRLARAQRPDVITLDVLMPGMDGWAVLSALKADPELADIPVIMLTIVDDKTAGYALGAAEYLTKPIDRGRLTAVLSKYRRDLPILVVDDDAGIRQLLRRILEGDGYTVVEAENGQAALARMGEQVPGAILLDLMMPEMDGFEFVSMLRAREAWREIPVVIITAKELTAEERERLNGSVVRILQKGAYGRDALLAEVRALVAASIGRRRGRA